MGRSRRCDALTVSVRARRAICLRPNAAVETALAYALVGETRQAEDRLARSGGDEVEMWPLGAVRAQRRPRHVREQLGLVEPRTPNEYVWETAYVYPQARFDLVWGDRQLRLRELARERERVQRLLQPGPALGPLVGSAEAELHLALGNGTRRMSCWRHPITPAFSCRVPCSPC